MVVSGEGLGSALKPRVRSSVTGTESGWESSRDEEEVFLEYALEATWLLASDSSSDSMLKFLGIIMNGTRRRVRSAFHSSELRRYVLMSHLKA